MLKLMIADALQARAKGAQAEGILDVLYEEGVTFREAVSVMSVVFSLSPSDANRMVSEHRCWRESAERNKMLRQQLLEVPTVQDKVLLLLRSAEQNAALAEPGATDKQLDALAGRLGRAIPHELRQWLMLINGSTAVPGGFLGIQTAQDVLDIETTLAWHPEWQEHGWIPVERDGLGNYHVLASGSTTSAGHPVLFLDHEQGYRPAYVAASNLWAFLRLLLEDELEMLDWQWPFDKEREVQEDPAIQECIDAPLPWDA